MERSVATSFFEKGAARFKEPGPAVFASGGFGTDFTLKSMLATFRPELCTFPLPTVSTALVMRSRWTGTAFLYMRLVLDRIRSPGKYRRFEANVGPEAVFGTDKWTIVAITDLMLLTRMIIHLFQFSFADTEQYFLRPPPTLINWWPSWWSTFDAVRAPSCSLRFV